MWRARKDKLHTYDSIPVYFIPSKCSSKLVWLLNLCNWRCNSTSAPFINLSSAFQNRLKSTTTTNKKFKSCFHNPFIDLYCLNNFVYNNYIHYLTEDRRRKFHPKSNVCFLSLFLFLFLELGRWIIGPCIHDFSLGLHLISSKINHAELHLSGWLYKSSFYVVSWLDSLDDELGKTPRKEVVLCRCRNIDVPSNYPSQSKKPHVKSKAGKPGWPN